MSKIIDSDSICNTCTYGFTHVEKGIFKQQNSEWEAPKIIARYVMYSMCTHPTITGADGVPPKWIDACVSCPLYMKKKGDPYCPTNTEDI